MLGRFEGKQQGREQCGSSGRPLKERMMDDLPADGSGEFGLADRCLKPRLEIYPWHGWLEFSQLRYKPLRTFDVVIHIKLNSGIRTKRLRQIAESLLRSEPRRQLER